MSKQKAPFDPLIRRIGLGTLIVFEITEAELESLEQGSPESLFLDFCIAAISIATSFFIALLTTTIDDLRTFCVFVIVCLFGFTAGVTYGLLWWQARRKMRRVAQEIRNRMLSTGIQDNPGQDIQPPA